MIYAYPPESAGGEALPPDTRSRKDVRQRHREVIALLERHVSVREIAAITGYCTRSVCYIARRYRESGLAALDDRRQHRAGVSQLLTPEQLGELAQALCEPPPDGGTWTGPKVAAWIAARTGRHVHRQRGWEYLRRLRAGQSPT
jgi:transposase